MECKFDPLNPDEARAIRLMLDALQAQGVGQSVRAVTSTPHLVPVPGADVYPHDPRLDDIAYVPAPTAQQSDAMDDTGGIRSVPVPLPPVPSTADATAPTSAPVDPQVFSAEPTSAPPAPSVPVPPVPSAPVADASLVLDASGLPWDERIHSSSRAFIAGGVWRQRRNLPDGEKLRVEADLRTRMGAPAQSAAPLPPVPVAPAVVPVPSPPATPTGTQPPAALAATWIDLVGNVTANAGIVSPEEITALCDKHGFPGGIMFMQSASVEQIQAVDRELQEMLA